MCLFGACAYGRWKWALNQVLVAPVAGEIGEVGYSPDIWTWNTWPTACGAAIPMHMYWITLLPPAGCGDSQITLHFIVMKLILVDNAHSCSRNRTRGHLLLCSVLSLICMVRSVGWRWYCVCFTRGNSVCFIMGWQKTAPWCYCTLTTHSRWSVASQVN